MGQERREEKENKKKMRWERRKRKEDKEKMGWESGRWEGKAWRWRKVRYGCESDMQGTWKDWSEKWKLKKKLKGKWNEKG